MTEKQMWSQLWRYIYKRTMLTEPAAKHAAALALEWAQEKRSVRSRLRSAGKRQETVGESSGPHAVSFLE